MSDVGKFEAVSKVTRSASEGDLALDIPAPSLTLRVTFRDWKPLLPFVAELDDFGFADRAGSFEVDD